MPLLYYVQTSAIGLAITLIIYIHVYSPNPYTCVTQKLFRLLLISNALLLALEMLVNIFTGDPSPFARLALPAIVCCFYSMNPVPEALWVLYLDATLHRETPHNGRRTAAIVLLPVALNAALSVVSLFSGSLFTIDADNVYRRGPYFWAMALSCYSYLVYYIALIVLKRKLVRRHEALTLFCAALPPIIAGVLQSAFFGLSILWVALSFSLLIVYMGILSSQVYTDHLTGLANRRKFDALLLDLPKLHKSVGGMMIDIDGFKKINDVYGHNVGDEVLERVGTILRHCLRKDDFAARIGGDEFAALIDASGPEQLAQVVNRIGERVKEFNRNSPYPFALSLSVGYDLFDPDAGTSPDDFFRRIDEKMYEMKKLNAAQ